MPTTREEWFERIRAAEREYLIARDALDVYHGEHGSARVKLPPDTDPSDLRNAVENLEGTYLVRLFAEFESGLRNWYATLKGTVPPARDLIDAIATRRKIPDEDRDEVHEVREYRNALVHETDSEAEAVPLADARHRLCTFFARLPEKW